MLATVECKESPVGLKNFLSDLFRPPEIEISKVSLPEADALYRVKVPLYRGEIPTFETAQKLKKLKGSVIFDINFPCDENTRCLEFHPKVLPSLLLFNCFTDYITAIRLPAVKSSLTVYDGKGIYCDIIERAVPLFSRIHICTREKRLYEKTAQRLYEAYGISLFLSETPTGKPPLCTAVLCAEKAPFRDFYPGILFTLEDNPPPSGCLITGEGVCLPGEYELVRPSGIGSLLFASALYEKCNVKKLGELSLRKVKKI